jgi:hypothetical protein
MPGGRASRQRLYRQRVIAGAASPVLVAPECCAEAVAFYSGPLLPMSLRDLGSVPDLADAERYQVCTAASATRRCEGWRRHLTTCSTADFVHRRERELAEMRNHG